MFTCNGIAFNHESERRGYEFVTRKITSTVAQIKYGLADELRLGNLDAKRDWGYSPEYVEAMWQMLQQDEAADYVLSTGETHSVREFARLAFEHAGLDWQDYVVVDEKFYRPAEIHELRGDPTKAMRKMGWQTQMKFEDLVAKMVENDLKQIAAEGTNPQKIKAMGGGRR